MAAITPQKSPSLAFFMHIDESQYKVDKEGRRYLKQDKSCELLVNIWKEFLGLLEEEVVTNLSEAVLGLSLSSELKDKTACCLKDKWVDTFSFLVSLEDEIPEVDEEIILADSLEEANETIPSIIHKVQDIFDKNISDPVTQTKRIFQKHFQHFLPKESVKKLLKEIFSFSDSSAKIDCSPYITVVNECTHEEEMAFLKACECIFKDLETLLTTIESECFIKKNLQSLQVSLERFLSVSNPEFCPKQESDFLSQISSTWDLFEHITTCAFDCKSHGRPYLNFKNGWKYPLSVVIDAFERIVKNQQNTSESVPKTDKSVELYLAFHYFLDAEEESSKGSTTVLARSEHHELANVKRFLEIHAQEPVIRTKLLIFEYLYVFYQKNRTSALLFALLRFLSKERALDKNPFHGMLPRALPKGRLNFDYRERLSSLCKKVERLVEEWQREPSHDISSVKALLSYMQQESLQWEKDRVFYTIDSMSAFAELLKKSTIYAHDAFSKEPFFNLANGGKQSLGIIMDLFRSLLEKSRVQKSDGSHEQAPALITCSSACSSVRSPLIEAFSSLSLLVVQEADKSGYQDVFTGYSIPVLQEMVHRLEKEVTDRVVLAKVVFYKNLPDFLKQGIFSEFLYETFANLEKPIEHKIDFEFLFLEALGKSYYDKSNLLLSLDKILFELDPILRLSTGPDKAEISKMCQKLGEIRLSMQPIYFRERVAILSHEEEKRAIDFFRHVASKEKKKSSRPDDVTASSYDSIPSSLYETLLIEYSLSDFIVQIDARRGHEKMNRVYLVGDDIGEGGNKFCSKATEICDNGTTFGRNYARIASKTSFLTGQMMKEKGIGQLLLDRGVPGIPPMELVLGYTGTERGWTFMLMMPFYEQGSLFRFIKKNPISLPERLRLALQMARTVSGMHEAGVIHLDLKPANFLIEEGSEIKTKLIDFEHSEKIGSSARVIPRNRCSYCTPELLGSDEAIEPSKELDTWALGMTFCELLDKSSWFPTLSSRFQDLYRKILDIKELDEHSQSPDPQKELIQVRLFVNTMISNHLDESTGKRLTEIEPFKEAHDALLKLESRLANPSLHDLGKDTLFKTYKTKLKYLLDISAEYSIIEQSVLDEVWGAWIEPEQSAKPGPRELFVRGVGKILFNVYKMELIFLLKICQNLGCIEPTVLNEAFTSFRLPEKVLVSQKEMVDSNKFLLWEVLKVYLSFVKVERDRFRAAIPNSVEHFLSRFFEKNPSDCIQDNEMIEYIERLEAFSKASDQDSENSASG